jgi:hypothetical protein
LNFLHPTRQVKPVNIDGARQSLAPTKGSEIAEMLVFNGHLGVSRLRFASLDMTRVSFRLCVCGGKRGVSAAAFPSSLPIFYVKAVMSSEARHLMMLVNRYYSKICMNDAAVVYNHVAKIRVWK